MDSCISDHVACSATGTNGFNTKSMGENAFLLEFQTIPKSWLKYS